jgi:AcrR family transcriptional regulator
MVDAADGAKAERQAPPGAPKPRRLTSAERRKAFLDKAIEVFAETGFEGSTRTLAARLGVTQPLLYRYFPSKEDLLAEVYRTVFVDRWRAEWTATLTDRSRPCRARLVAFYLSYTETIYDLRWMRIYLHAGLKGLDLNRQYLALVRERIIAPVVAERRAEAGLPERPATSAEIEFVWVIHGGVFYHGVRRHIYRAAVEQERRAVIEAAVDAMLLGLDRLWAAPPSQPP